VNDDFGHI